MLAPDRVAQLKDLLPQTQSAIVLLGPTPGIDHLASALALSRSLQLAGKAVEIASPNELAQDLKYLPEATNVKQKMGNKNLSISFPYQETAVDKVSYHISEDNKSFYLVIKPQKGHKPLDSSQVEFDYSGADADLVFLVGVHSFESLDHLYSSYQQLFDQATVITINSFEPEIGQIKLDVSGVTSMSEAVAGLLLQLETPIDDEVATHLLAGIEEMTNGFQSLTTTAETFETVANLMRTGARRLKRPAPVISADQLRTVTPAKPLAPPAPIAVETPPPALRQSPITPQPPQPPIAPPPLAATTNQPSGPGLSEQNTVFGKALKQKIKRNQKKKKTKGEAENDQAGSLKYQPSKLGPGGGG